MRKLLWLVCLLGVSSGAAPPNEDAVIAAATGNLAKLRRVTETPFKMDAWAAALCEAPRHDLPHDPHDEAYGHVYVNVTGHATLLAGKGTYPVNSLIVKQKFADAAGKEVELFTVMRKMPAGYNTGHGDWEYSVVERTGKTVLSRGRTESCIECHAAYARNDYVTRLYLPPPGKAPVPKDDTGNSAR